jgi:DNA polymerase delta subunit 2
LSFVIFFFLSLFPLFFLGALEHKTVKRSLAATAADFSFVVKKPNYEKQYAPLYFSRLSQMRSLVEQQVTGLGTALPYRAQLKDVVLQEECWVVGTVYRDMADRPAALDAYSDKVKPVRDCYASAADAFVVEDETGRASLRGEEEILLDLVTGLVVGLRVREEESGELLVLQVVHCGHAPLVGPLQSDNTIVALVSGKLAGLRGELLVNYLSGSLGAPRSQQQVGRIARLMILGNSIGAESSSEQIKHHHQAITAEDEAKLLLPVLALDSLLAHLCGALAVDLLPGPLDPAAQCLPQQPLSPVLFPQASQWNSLNCVTNPYRTTVGSAQILASAGQIIDNLQTYSSLSRLDSAANLLKWRHQCPTCPDTLACYPAEEDMFVLHNSPHLLAFGNQPSFQTRHVLGSRVVLVPDFNTTGCLVLVDLATLNVNTVAFALDQ